MRTLPKITVGLAGISFSPFYAFREEQYQRRCQALAACLQPWGAKVVPVAKTFATAEGGSRAAAELQKAGPALVILDICTFPEGKAMEAFFAGITAPLAIWSRCEGKKHGPIGHNSFCGANFAGANLALRHRRFRTLFGEVEDKEFQARLCLAIRLLQAAEAARGAAIGLIGGGIVPKFFDIDMDENDRAALASRWGVRFVPIAFDEWFEAAKQTPDAVVHAEVKRQAKCYRGVAVPAEALATQARQLLGLRCLAEKMHLAALAVRCWPEPQQLAASWPCGSIGHLNDLGIPTACEGDPVGAWDMLLARQLSSQPSTLVDIIDFDDRADTITIWHCGPGPISWADEKGVKLIPHNVDGANARGRPKPGLPAVHDMGFKPGKVTILRTLGALDDEFVFAGKLGNCSAAKRICGSYGVVGNLHQYGTRLSAREIRNQIMARRIPHHYAAFRQDERLMPSA